MMEKSTATNEATADGFPQKPSFDVLDPTAINSSSALRSTVRIGSISSSLKPEEHSCQAEDSEISIFDAQKYFNESSSSNEPRVSKRVSAVTPTLINLECISEKSEYLSSVPRFSSSSSDNRHGRSYGARSVHAMSSTSSEASWNSQTRLLSNSPGAVATSMENSHTSTVKKRGCIRKWLLGRGCPCSGKKSVQVEERVSESRTPSCINLKTDISLNPNKQTPPESVEKAVVKEPDPPEFLQRQERLANCQKILSSDSPFCQDLSPHCLVASSFDDSTCGFTFPILSETSSPVKLTLNGLPLTTYKPAPVEDPPRESLEVFKPKTPEHSRCQSFSFPASPRVAAVTDDDLASDASSDLFEIESFSTQTTSYPLSNSNHRDSLDEASNFQTRRSATTNTGGVNLFFRSLEESITTEAYEPSEASIAWSVTTVDGFDRRSVTNFSVTASEADPDRTTSRTHSDNDGGDGSSSGGKRRGSGSGGVVKLSV